MADEEEIDILGEDQEEDEEDETEKRRPKRKRRDDEPPEDYEDEEEEDDEIDLLDISDRATSFTKVDLIIYIVLLVIGLIIGWLLSSMFSKIENVERETQKARDEQHQYRYYMDNPENREYYFGKKPAIPPEIMEKEESTLIGLTTHSPKMPMHRDESGEIIIEDDSQYDVERWVVKRNKRTGKVIDLTRTLNR